MLAAASVAVTAAMAAHAWNEKHQFYPAVVYITKCNACMIVVYHMSFVTIFAFGMLLRKLFFGTLRAAEVEHLYERTWYAVTETCLAMTMFREEFNGRFIFFFAMLLFNKVFHWLARDRVNYMEQAPVIPRLFHVRMVVLLVCLTIIDLLFSRHAVNSFLTQGTTSPVPLSSPLGACVRLRSRRRPFVR